MKTRILVVDAQILERECLVFSLEREPDFEVVAQCSLIEDALEIIRQQEIHVLLFSYQNSSFQGYTFLQNVRQSLFSGHILIKVSESNRRSAEQVARLVSAEVVSPTAGITQLIESIHSAERRSRMRPPSALSLSSLGRDAVFPTRFTARELHVLKAVMDGLANKEIAAQLDVSESSVKCTVQQLFRKTAVRTRSQLVRKVLEAPSELRFSVNTKIA